jgi:ABC-type dipeptide/oligopeptide/nickel transport system ATPase component
MVKEREALPMILEFHSGAVTAKLESSQKVLVRDVAFELQKGECLALIGETGSGKTMTAMLLMGLLPSNVSAADARITFCGEPIPKSRQKLLGVEMVYIPQNGLEFLNPSKKVRSHLYDSLQKLGVHRKQRERIALQKLAEVGFEQPETVIDKYPFQLSGGMAQRVTIAIAACSQAKLVIADEPTNGLDHEAKVRFMDMLKNLFPDAAKLIITHDIGVAALCTKTLVLCGGKMMETGPSSMLLSQPKHPYTTALIRALVKNGMCETPILRSGIHDCPFYTKCAQGNENCCRCHKQGNGREWWCSQV